MRPRCGGKVEHRLSDILVISVCAVIACADHIEMLHRRFGCDGMAFTLPVWSPEEIRRVGELVLARLEAKGIWILPASRDWGW